MDREELAAMLGALEDGKVAVKPDGSVWNSDADTEFTPEQILEQIADATALIERLKRIAEWAKLAPEVEGK